MNNVCICIPARLDSSRLPSKLMMKCGEQTVIEKTVDECKKCKLVNEVFVLTDSDSIFSLLNKDDSIKVIKTYEECMNGTERISKHLHEIDDIYRIIVNIQGDEPYIDYRNIDYAIQKHMDNTDENVFYSTLHQRIHNINYLHCKSCITVEFSKTNNVIKIKLVIPITLEPCIDNDKGFPLSYKSGLIKK